MGVDAEFDLKSTQQFPLPKERVEDFACHHEQKQHYKGLLKRKLGASHKRPVSRQLDRDGYRLPTSGELELVETIASRIRYELPIRWHRELWFVRRFLDVFAFASDVSYRDVKWKCSLAKSFVLEGESYLALAAKLGVSNSAAEILFDWALQRTLKRRSRDATARQEWFVTDDEDLDQPMDASIRAASSLLENDQA